MYRALFVDPSLGALIPIVLITATGAVLSTIRKIARLGVTILVTGVLAFLLYLAWKTGYVEDLVSHATSALPSSFTD